jgi:hypothetical protein
MFKLKKTHHPLGTEAAPLYESSYSEGIIKVVDGFCEVNQQDSRDLLLKLGYVEVTAPVGVVDKVLAKVKGKGRR